MPPTTTRPPPAIDDGFPTDRELQTMTDDGGPLCPRSARQTAADRAARRGVVLARRSARRAENADEHRPPADSSRLTLAGLLLLEADLTRDIAAGVIGAHDPAAAAVVGSLRLAGGRTNEHAVGVARRDIQAIADTARVCFADRFAPELGDVLHVPGGGR